MEDVIINKVANSQIITLNLENFFPEQIELFDLKDFLYLELILKEKEFRESLKNVEWKRYEQKYVRIFCSSDAIVPLWAYMLVTSYLQPYTKLIFTGSEDEAMMQAFLQKLSLEDFAVYKDKRMVLKGCGDRIIPEYAYVAITNALLPFVKSIMYGEPCSTVPVFKKK